MIGTGAGGIALTSLSRCGQRAVGHAAALKSVRGRVRARAGCASLRTRGRATAVCVLSNLIVIYHTQYSSTNFMTP